MPVVTCKVDDARTVVLPESFAGRTVEVETVSESEVRIRVVKPPRHRPSLREMLARITDENQHPEVSFGPPVGNEVL